MADEDAVTLALIGKVLGFVGEAFGEGLEALGDVSKAGYWVCRSILWNQGQGGVSLVELDKDALGVGPDIKAGVAPGELALLASLSVCDRGGTDLECRCRTEG